MEKFNKAQEVLKKYHQEHLLRFFDNLDEEKKDQLLEQILEVDFELLNSLYENRNKTHTMQDIITPIEYIDKSKLKEEQLEKYRKKGAEVIRNNKYAVVTMAGGQGSRLGYNGAKGKFLVELNPSKSLFQILTEKLIKVKEEYSVSVPWYIMTSKENDNETKEFFEENNYFGYPKNSITFFTQGEIPMLDENGKIILTEEKLIKEAANGHGGIFESMFKHGIVKDMKSKGIEWVFIGPIENILVKMADEIMIGYAIEKNVYGVGKSVAKVNPEEKVGVFCKRNGRPSVVEYTEITSQMAHQTDEQGELVFGESHLNCNIFNIKAIDKIGNEKLPYHTALKKATYINDKGALIKSEKPTCYKFETFIFDAFEKLDDMVVLRGKREEEFAPIKNKEGVDSPETAIKLYNNFNNRKD